MATEKQIQKCTEQCRDMARQIKRWTKKHKDEPIVIAWHCEKEAALHATVSHGLQFDLMVVSEPARRMIHELLERYPGTHEPTVFMLRRAMQWAGKM